jgi:hypothetical protein
MARPRVAFDRAVINTETATALIAEPQALFSWLRRGDDQGPV